MSTRSGFLFLLVLLAVFTQGKTDTLTYPDSATVTTIMHVQEKLSNSEYQAADSLCASLIKTHPGDPAGYLFRGVRLLNEMFEREEPTYKDELFATLDTVVLLAERIRDTAHPHLGAWMSLWIGHAKTHKSLWESRFGIFTSALRTGLQAKSEYERGWELDSSVTDLLFGLGNYHYWKSVKAGMLTSVGLFSDERDQGILELQKAATSSVVSQEAAKDAAIWILYDQNKYDSVITQCEERIQQYPQGWQFYWPLAMAYYASSRYMKAANTFDALRTQYSKEPGNYVNLVTCDYYLYLCYDALNNKEQCRVVADNFMKYYRTLPDFCKQRRRDKIDFLRRAARL